MKNNDSNYIGDKNREADIVGITNVHHDLVIII